MDRRGSSGSRLGSQNADVFVEMRPAGDEAVRAMLGQMLVAFGGEVVKLDMTSDMVLLKFPSEKAAADFQLQGHTFTVVADEELLSPPSFPAPTTPTAADNAPPAAEATPSTSESSPAAKEVVPALGSTDDAAATSVHPTKPFQQMSITELYKATDTKTSKTGGRQPLSDSDMFYVFANPHIMSPLLCAIMMLYCSGCIMGAL
eukprot:GHVS01021579.1.p1 GENE.GHVS01021579.1~~GHVS01021579.1.p1  ORF type:complete len:203 (+),score=47.77 GHVS01021579.1:150-758(+)